MKMNEVIIQNSIEKEKVRIMRKNSLIDIPLIDKQRIGKDALNCHQKRLFYLFKKKMEYLRSVHKTLKNREIDWDKVEFKLSADICNKRVELFYYENYTLSRYDKELIVGLDVFNSLKTNF